MRVLKMVLAVSSVVGVAACGGGETAAKSLESDLAWLDSVSVAPAAPVQPQIATPVELTTVTAPTGGFTAANPKAAMVEEKPAVATETRSRRSSSSRSRGTSARRSSGGSSGTYASTPARQPRIVTKRNTVRDAAIGAGAGAVIGAVAGGRRNRVKGALIGAGVGGAAGAVIGSTVDVSRRVEY
ncbi:MAG TPA: YMGG-like glycine zipper-containing protein [Longimicrobium sp.]|nr:YMGG-like glycine zipper-containing protein [Longimicrobium sp.]